jgi:hypothetical protein
MGWQPLGMESRNLGRPGGLESRLGLEEPRGRGWWPAYAGLGLGYGLGTWDYGYPYDYGYGYGYPSYDYYSYGYPATISSGYYAAAPVVTGRSVAIARPYYVMRARHVYRTQRRYYGGSVHVRRAQ